MDCLGGRRRDCKGRERTYVTGGPCLAADPGGAWVQSLGLQDYGILGGGLSCQTVSFHYAWLALFGK